MDSGTGNGKYLRLDRQGKIWTIGLDRSINLLKIAQCIESPVKTREVILGNVLDHCWRDNAFVRKCNPSLLCLLLMDLFKDYAISIATIHHLAAHNRRMLAVQVSSSLNLQTSGSDIPLTGSKRLLQCVSPDHGRILIYVWAIEQDELSKRIIPQDSSDRSGVGKDVVVPWVLSKQNTVSANDASCESQEGCQIYNRYYHMFAKGELRSLVSEAAAGLDILVGTASGQERLCQGVEIVQDGWERSNYYVELRRWSTL